MEEATLKICAAITEVGLDGELSDRIKRLRIQALRQVNPILQYYYKEFGRNNPIVMTICEKKIAFILEAISKAEIDLILSPPSVRYNYVKVVPSHRFVIPEEELLVWMQTAAIGPLNEKGYTRCEELFLSIFPDFAHIFVQNPD